MPQPIVDLLEPIQIQQQHRHRPAPGARSAASDGPEKIAAAVSWLIPPAAYVTGSDITISGGL